MAKKIKYYEQFNDDFVGNNIQTKSIKDDYKYINTNLLYIIVSFFLYHFIAIPIVFLYMKIVFNQKFVNKKLLKKSHNSGFFIYGNHTHIESDAFTPSLLSFPYKNFLICNPNATSIKGIKTLVKMLGAIPIPSTIKSSKKYLEAIKYYIKNKNTITIYPEAHLWPYYTDIRPFDTSSFHYPYLCKVASYTCTTIYVKRKIKFIKKPKIINVIDGPFYPDYTLSKKQSIEKLKKEIESSFKRSLSKYEKYEYIIYKKK